MEKITSRNPITGETLAEFDSTPIDQLTPLYARARGAQAKWGALSPKKRSTYLYQLRESLLNHTDDLARLISLENGKPRFEALSNELLPSVTTLTYYAKAAPRALRDRRIPLQIMKHRTSYLNRWPLGVVLIISPWNYPFFLPFAQITAALAAGNAVIFKPSEHTPQVALRIQDLIGESGFPRDLVQVALGDGSLGAALIEQRPDKIFFTGSAQTGRRILAAAAPHLIPVNLELGGQNAMIVLPDANLELATSAALWGGFSNSGQMCASVQRILVHERIAQSFASMLKEKLEAIPIEDRSAITLEAQKRVYERHLDDARSRGLTFASGGEFDSDRTRLKPTLISGPGVEDAAVFNEETFGPVVAIATFRSVDEAVEKSNRSHYGLVASVFTRDHRMGEALAKRLHVGTVTINEVSYTAGLAETPWGGIKDSGVGRTHSEVGLYEFTHLRHIHKPRSRLLVFKSPWWFPYSPFQYQVFRTAMELFRRHTTDKLKAFPLFLWNLAQLLKRERRL